jgi:hypothetical protein
VKRKGGGQEHKDRLLARLRVQALRREREAALTSKEAAAWWKRPKIIWLMAITTLLVLIGLALAVHRYHSDFL